VSRALIVRHAQSTWNAEGRWQGQADPPLSPAGEAQAATAAARLASDHPFDLVVSSDLRRARRTAEILMDALGLRCPHLIEAGLREYDVAAWSGYTRDEIHALWPDELARFNRGELDAPPGGEGRDDFDRRVRAAGGRVARVAEEMSAALVLVVTHGGVIRSLARSHGLGEYRAGPLAGYHGDITDGSVLPRHPVDLLDPDSATASRAGQESGIL